MVISKGRTELELRHLSDGERYLLTLGADIARRLALANPAAEDPGLCSAVILIDEIDTHLHPSWQRRIIPALASAFPNCQFIITTHSPQVLSNVRPESIYLLTQEDGELRVMRPEASFGRDSNRILEDIMGVDERPSGIKQKLSDYFYLLDQGKMEEARSLRQELESLIGPSDPEFARADAITRARELIDEAHR
jgi:predicted ATP-binding protein involved in virulence